MWEAVCATLNIIMWIGAILGLLLIVNTVSGTICNLNKGERFSWKKFFQGIGKAVAFYISIALLSVATTLLPFINTMVVEVFGVEFLAPAVLDAISTTAIFGIAASAIVIQGKKALENVIALAKISNIGGLKLPEVPENQGIISEDEIGLG